MRICMFTFAAALAVSTALAHGPQIQITNDGGKITTGRVIKDGPYSASLAAATTVYVMPLLDLGGVRYARPNTDLDPVTHLPEFFSGPGLAYGYDLVDGGPQAFAAGSVLSLAFLDELKLWNSAAFDDAGTTQLKAFRGSNVNIISPAANLAVSGNDPADLLSLDAVLPGYSAESNTGPEVHSTIRYALLGNGTSPTSPSVNGVYLAKLQVSSTQSNLAPSDPFYFVLHKNADPADVAAAVNELGFGEAFVQYVPEPDAFALAAAAVGLVLSATRRRS